MKLIAFIGALALLNVGVSLAQESDETATARANAAPASFTINEYRIVGVTLLPQIKVEGAVYPHLGEGKTIDDVERARKALEDAYRGAGYGTVFVDIPPQDVVGGVVNLRVTEGRVEQLRITGSRYFSPQDMRVQVPALAEGEAPNLKEVERQLIALNRVSGDRAVTPVLRPGKTPGTVEVELRVKDQLPLHGGIEYNNAYTTDTSHRRMNVSLRYDNLWQKAHSFGLQFQTAPRDTHEVQVYSGTYVWKRPPNSWLPVAYAVRSKSHVVTIGDLLVVGRGDIYGLRLIRSVEETRRGNQRVTLGIDYKDFDERTELQQTPIDYTVVTVQYNARRRTARGETSWDLGAHFGLRALGNAEAEFEDKRRGARPNFVYWKGGVEHARATPFDTRLRARFEAQFADTPLVSNEQFSSGGADGVRGYNESQQLGDNALQLNLELHGPSFAERLGKRVQDAHLLGFFDFARLQLRSSLAGQEDRHRLAGAGVGMRFQAFNGLEARLDWAQALKDSGRIQGGDRRLHFRVEYAF